MTFPLTISAYRVQASLVSFPNTIVVTFMHVTFVLPHGDIIFIHWRKYKMHQSENRTQMTEDD